MKLCLKYSRLFFSGHGVVGAATAKLREPKHVRTRGTNSNLESDERKATLSKLITYYVFTPTQPPTLSGAAGNGQ